MAAPGGASTRPTLRLDGRGDPAAAGTGSAPPVAVRRGVWSQARVIATGVGRGPAFPDLAMGDAGADRDPGSMPSPTPWRYGASSVAS